MTAAKHAEANNPVEIHRGVAREGGVQSVKPVHLHAPGDAAFAELVDVMYTLGRASFAQYHLAVETDGEQAYLRLDPPRFMAGQPEPPKVAVFVLIDGFRVTHRGSGGLETLPRDLKRLDAALATIKNKNPRTVNMVVSAENDVTVGELVEVIDVGAGPGCPPHRGLYEVDESRCRFPYLTIEAGAG